MADSRLRLLSFILVVIGIAVLFYLSQASPRTVLIHELSDEHIGMYVRTAGAVQLFSTNDGHVFVQLEDGHKTLKIVIFRDTAAKYPWLYDVRLGDTLSVSGKVQTYNGELEIVADAVE